MEEYDQLDLKVLAELDKDARKPMAQMAKKIGVSGCTVANRMKSLEEKGIIKRYECTTDLFRLGMKSYRIYLKLRRAGNSMEKEMMDYLCASPLTTWCGNAGGQFDITAFLAFHDHGQAVSFWNGFLAKYRPYISRNTVVPFCGDVQSRNIFMDTNSESIATGMEKTSVDKKDMMLLRMLTDNCRANLESMGMALGLKPATVLYRINNLVKKGVIRAFRPVVDMNKLGYSLYKADINLAARANMADIEKYILNKPGVSHILKTIGWADIEMQAYSKTSRALSALLHEIQDQFPDDVQDYSFFEYFSTTKDSFAGALIENNTS